MSKFLRILLFDFMVGNGFGAVLSSTGPDVQNMYQEKSMVKYEQSAGITSIVTVSVLLGMTVGSLLTPMLIKRFRKTFITQICGAVCVIFNGLCCVPVHWSLLLISRFGAGFGQSVIQTIIPGWMADLLDQKQRPVIMVLYQAFGAFGIFINYLVKLGIKQNAGLYQLNFAYTMLINVCTILCTFLIKEQQQTQTHIAEMVEDVIQVRKRLGFWSREMRKSLCNCVFLSVGTQFTGINVVIMYAAAIFAKSLQMENAAIMGSIIVGIANLLPIAFPVAVLKCAGRKTLLMSGWFICCTGLLGLFIIYSINAPNSDTLIILLSIVFLIGFEIGPGPIVYLMVGEIYPKQFRNQLISSTYTLMWISNLVIIFTFPYFQNSINIAYALYFVISFSMAIGILFTIPETKGKSLEQIENEVTRVKHKGKQQVIQLQKQTVPRSLSLLEEPQFGEQLGQSAVQTENSDILKGD